ncbi:embryogenesis-associated protein EMB8-like isoform X1 [Solanum pennellii]|uniref:Embryogenesis-associated protein EMB8-like isoform X1 n=1 Tax=Solanum pennellii TaxID=28526 RepID=A0ABM1VDR2_SOLPN|nr:embryogenesis-associated protein EMB8-like isoform X1 [Solanum pennellii]
MDSFELSSESPYELLLKVLFLIPISHYLLGFLFLLSVFLYNFIEMYFIQEFFTGFRGKPVSLTYNSCCDLYQEVVSKCKTLNGRVSSTPWLCSPHLQTAFLQFFGRAPACKYRRQIFQLSDGGIIALDWLRNIDVEKPSIEHFDGVQSDDKSPIMLVIPGLTSDSDSAYIKHLTLKMAKRGWNVVVSNHRGLGGVSVTSDCFYNAGWTEDSRRVIDHLHTQYPQAPLFAVGLSIGANVLVKYLGEEGVNTVIVGAAAICSPWDLLICDRYINRRLVQRVYDRALAIGLKGYAKMHQTVMSRLADWEGIVKARSVRDFDHSSTRVLADLETVDTYYRKASCTSYIGNVMVPLLCVSALDDPVCTREAIPWDECRANKNIVLATTHHGGHLGYFEGMTAKSLWWVRAVDEFLCGLNSSSLIHSKKMQITKVHSPLETSIDQAPYVNIREDGLVTAFSNEPSGEVGSQQNEQLVEDDKVGDRIRGVNDAMQLETNASTQFDLRSESTRLEDAGSRGPGKMLVTPEPELDAVIVPVKRCLNQLSQHSKISMWVLAYIAIITTWPILGSASPMFFKKKLRIIFSLKR